MHYSTYAAAILYCSATVFGVTEAHAQTPLFAAKGTRITLKRGFVCITADYLIKQSTSGGLTPDVSAEDNTSGDLDVRKKEAADHFWDLDPYDAMGIVVESDRQYATVEFDSRYGWARTTITSFKRPLQILDYWGDPYICQPTGGVFRLQPEENGLLLSGEDAGGKPKLPIRVRFPLRIISFASPQFGDLVVRGPDWNKGAADGQPGWTGKVIRFKNESLRAVEDGYVTVEWNATKRRGRYRWDYNKKFDVVPVARDEEGPTEETLEGPEPAIGGEEKPTAGLAGDTSAETNKEVP